MKLYEEINKNRREYFATATKKEKFKYIMDYYGFRTIVALIVLTIIIVTVVKSCTAPDVILNGTFINLSQYGRTHVAAELEERFLKDQKIDASEFTVSFGNSLIFSSTDVETTSASYQALAAQASAGTLDFIVSSPDSVMTYAYEGLFVDLTTVLSKEQIEMYEPYFLYVDKEVAIQKEDMTLSSDEIFEENYPDCRKPEEMKKPIPVLIDLSQSKTIKDLYNAKKIDLCYGIVDLGENKDNAIIFLDYIMKK